MYEYELEALAELEEESEGEFELEGEYESEEFLRRVGALVRRLPLRRVGLAAARSALGGLGQVGGAIGGAPGSAGAALGTGIGSGVGAYLTGLLPQSEFEFEGEWELEGEVNPLRRVYPDALMEHMAHAAAESESEAEAEAFIGALIPMAARLIPRVAPAIMRAAPQLVRGVANVTRTLRRNPATRPLVRAVPTIVRRTAASIAQQASQGRRVTPQTAVRTLARQTASVLGNPRRCVRAVRRSHVLDRRHHRAVGPAAAAVPRRVAPRPAMPCAQCGR